MTGIAFALSLLFASPAAPPELRLVYEGQEGGYAIVRTPQLLVTQAGTFLAFAQGRSGTHDQSDNDILVKRSTDGGRIWSKFQVIADQGADALNSICVVQVRPSGRILAIGCSFPAGYEQMQIAYQSAGMQEYQKRAGRENNPAIRPGYEGKDISRNYVVHSDDDGRTWSAMRDVTAMVKPPAPALSCVPGPGVAIQMTAGPHAGRIVVPCNSRGLDSNRTPPAYFTLPYAVYSDDLGQTWTRGQLAPPGSTHTAREANESQVVELPGGRLLMNSRTAQRAVTVSADGGQTWSPLKDEAGLPCPATAAGFIRYDPVAAGASGRLLFSNPTEPKRVHGVIFLSPDNGQTWPVQKTLRAGRFGYSCLARLPEGDVGCVFEGLTEPGEFGDKVQKAVLLARFPLQWLTDAPDQ